MTFPNIFSKAIADQVVDRINTLTPGTAAQWGKMNVGQMLAHCCVTYETIYTDDHPRPNALSRFLIKLLAKNTVVGPKPYPKNGRTASHFLITDERDFEKEKSRLVEFIRRTEALGEMYFDNKDSHSMGTFTIDEWNSLFYKHLDHHLTQFGV